MANTKNKTRIAPTPSGYLHMGNAISFAITWALAKQSDHIVALRIDDLDNARYRKEYVDNIFETLKLMGIDYQEGPLDTDDFLKHYSQRYRIASYTKMIGSLVKDGLVYACDCSRSEIQHNSPHGQYPRTCLHKNIPLDTPNVSWRLRIPEHTTITFNDEISGQLTVCIGQTMPDFVIRRKDQIPSYQIASLCDDIEMGCNLIVRGKDLLDSTAAQLYLSQLVSNSTFPQARFVHHPLLKDSNGEKLSKSHDSLSVYQFEKGGVTAQTIWEHIFDFFNIKNPDTFDASSFLRSFRLHLLENH